MKKFSVKGSSIPAGIGLGLLAALGVTLLGAAVMAWLQNGEILSEEGMPYGALIVWAVAGLAGALVSAGLVGKMRLQVCMITASVYYGLLAAITALVFGGEYSGLGIAAVVILLSGAGAAFLGNRRKNTGKMKIKKLSFR